jgi:hypothetical protein
MICSFVTTLNNSDDDADDNINHNISSPKLSPEDFVTVCDSHKPQFSICDKRSGGLRFLSESSVLTLR